MPSSLRKRTMLKSHKSLNEGRTTTSSSSSEDSQPKSNRTLRSSHSSESKRNERKRGTLIEMTGNVENVHPIRSVKKINHTFTKGSKYSKSNSSISEQELVKLRKASDLSSSSQGDNDVISDEYHAEDDITLNATVTIAEIKKDVESGMMSNNPEVTESASVTQSEKNSITSEKSKQDVKSELIDKGKPSPELRSMNEFRNRLLADTKENLVDIALRCHEMCQEYQIKYKNLHDQIRDHRLNEFMQMKEEWKNKHYKENEEVKKLIESSVFKFEGKVIKLESEKCDLQSENKQMLEKIHQLEKQIKESEINEQRLITESDMLGGSVSELEILKKRFVQESETRMELEVKVNNLNDQVTALEKVKHEAVEKNVQYVDEISMLKNSLTNDQQALELQVDENQKLIEKNVELSNENKQMVATIQQLEKQVKEFEINVQKLVTETDMLGDSVSELEILKKKIVQESETRMELEMKVNNLNDQVTALEKVKHEAVEKNVQYVEEISLLKKSLTNDQQALELQVDEKQKLIEKNVEQEQSLADLILEKEKMTEKNNELQDEVLLLKKSIDCESVTNLELISAKEKLQNRVTSLETEKEELLGKVQVLSDKIVETEEQNSKISIDNKQNVDEIVLLKQQISALENEKIALEERNTGIAGENLKLWQMSEDEDVKLTASDVVCSLFPKSYDDLMKNSFLQWFKEDNIDIKKISLYEDVIIGLQDVLDFYALLTGISIWKSDCFNGDNEGMRIENRKCSQYFCQLSGGQNDVSCDGYRFILDLDNDEKVIKYSPDSNVVLNCPLPKVLVDPASYTLDQSRMFLKGLLGGV